MNSKRISVTKIGISLLSFLFGFVLLVQDGSAGTLSFREKKKSIERKIRILEESKKAIPFQKQTENWNRLVDLRDRFQTSYRSGSAREREEALLLLERAVPQVTADFAQEGKSFAKNLIVSYSEGYLRVKNHPEDAPLSASREEKAANYFRMAKEELGQAEKFDRDRNDFYAIVLYGRSIQYSLSAMEIIGLETPAGFEGILKKKIKP
ncbi:hypothetical protein DLM76_12080 [Leptospira yasudae]|uniref:Uncharacterized protein n=1 Tax=Leptospira yasudae TaxID=2202201 RepID=A0ABX9M3X7_9LEPT|nr:hypothetical protein [Leptospira yasudae]RHX80314.1 hypothetical protein DLM77_10795 [Leptospira yasudae]RHX93738.1 hypothetical protein DLM76_12080 [Leptospira yasudae]